MSGHRPVKGHRSPGEPDERDGRPLAGCRVDMERRTPRAARSGRVRLQGFYASHDFVAGRPDLFGRTAESVVAYWPGGILAGVQDALAPCPGIRARSEP
jgi:hypothetical protein